MVFNRRSGAVVRYRERLSHCINEWICTFE
jgi:hypothetical protein